MNTINKTYVDALLADAAYVEGLFDGMTKFELNGVLANRMTPTLAKFISEKFEIVSHKESNDILGSGFDATVWRGVAGSEFAGQVFVSMRGTEGAQDIVSDVDLALPFGIAKRQIVSMVNWWNQITTPTTGQAAQIQLVPILGTAIPAPTVAGTGTLTLSGAVQVVGHSLGGHLASAFARLMGDHSGVGGVPIAGVTTFNSAGFTAGSITRGRIVFH